MTDYITDPRDRLLDAALDGELDAAREAKLFDELAVDAALRSELREAQAIRGAARAYSASMIPPAELGTRLFSRLGVDVAPLSTSSASLTARLQSLRGRTPFFITLGGAILLGVGALYFSGTGVFKDEAAGTSTMEEVMEEPVTGTPVTAERIFGGDALSERRPNSTPASGHAPVSPGEAERKNAWHTTPRSGRTLLAETGPVAMSENTPGLRQNAEKRPVAGARPAAGDAYDGPVAPNAAADPSTGKPRTQAAYPAASIRPEPESAGEAALIARVIPLFTPRGKDGANEPAEFDIRLEPATSFMPAARSGFSARWRGYSAASSPSTALPSKSDPVFRNMAAAVLYSITEEHAIGIEGGQEAFPQKFDGIENGLRVSYEQNLLTPWMTGIYRYRPLWAKPSSALSPFISLGAGVNREGWPTGRAALGAQYSLTRMIAVEAAVEGALLAFPFKDHWFSTGKIGVSYGILVSF